MGKGVPWSKAEVDRLLNLRGEGKTVQEIAASMGKSEQSITKKLHRLGFKVVHLQNSDETTTSLIVPSELISIEEALKVTISAMEILKSPGLSKTEILRLKTLLAATSSYMTKVASYMNYLGVERELVKLREEYEELAKEQQKKSGKLADSREVKKDGK